MSATAIHILFDTLAWLTSLTTIFILRRTWFPKQPVTKPLRVGYIIALIFGAGVGAWLFGTANLWLSGVYQFGRSIEGALAGAIVAIEIYKKLNGITARTGAIYALPMTLGIAVGRIGCLLSGLKDFTYGIPTGAAWGWDFGDGILRHPVQLYETIAMLAFATLYAIMIKRGSISWRTNGFYYAVAFYAIERFILEFFKPYGSLVANLTIFQLLSIGLLGYAVLMMRGEKTQ
ncbi:MAG: prolipoprotein diacylglyceryl transferase family protein [Rhizobiaceae bacterium]